MPRGLLLLCCGLALAAAAACGHDCTVRGRPGVYFDIQSCCTSQPKYYWDGAAKDCVALSPAMSPMNCGCVCQGDCSRLYWSLDECRREYSSCR